MPQKMSDDPRNDRSTAAPHEPQPGLRLVRTLKAHADWIRHIAWSPAGRLLASASDDRTIRLWNASTGECVRTLEGHEGEVWALAFGSAGHTLASGGSDNVVRIWHVASGLLLRTMLGHGDGVTCVAIGSSDRFLASGSLDGTINLWETASGRLARTLESDGQPVRCVAFNKAGTLLASGSSTTQSRPAPRTVRIWDVATGLLVRPIDQRADDAYGVAFDPEGDTALLSGHGDHTIRVSRVSNGRLLHILEGHTGIVDSVEYSMGARLIASKSDDGTVRLWRADTFESIAVIDEPKQEHRWHHGVALHPNLPLLATVGFEGRKSNGPTTPVIRIWEFDLRLLGKSSTIAPGHYINAKAVLLGDTGVGKSGLSLVLNGQPYEATDSTPGRRVWTFQYDEIELPNKIRQTREVLLWDMAGQPGYRVVHQLHLNEVAVALIVFDARSEIDPLAGVRHWERALRLAQQRQGTSSIQVKKFLVSARADRGTVSLSKDRLDALVRECGFDGYFETSAKEGWQVAELKSAIAESIPWGELPEVSSSVLFAKIKTHLLRVKETGQLVALASQLYDDYLLSNPDEFGRELNLRGQFETCIGRLENRDLIRRLSFGNYVLLQPELLDAYASAMVNAAKKEPDGLGSLAEDVALAGQFYVPEEQKVKDRGQEQLLLHATVEELTRHDLALRESATDGRYLVFPSEFVRDYEAAPEPKGKALAITFDGPVQSLYSTLAVRLGHSGLFATGRSEMWRNAAVFKASAGGRCGIYLHEFAEARGRLVIFYDQFDGKVPTDETRFHFEEFVLAHVERRALDGSVDVVRFFVCPKCGTPIPDAYVKMLRDSGQIEFNCFCPGRGVVSLTEPKDRLGFPSKVEAMERAADEERDVAEFIQSARGEMITPSFTAWAGDDRVTLAIVFTDIVGSTALGQELKDEGMGEVRRAHFDRSRELLAQNHGREIKTIGDSFMVAFRSVENALGYARSLRARPGHSKVKIRAGIHIGPVLVDEDDVFGGAVDFAARVVGAISGPEIWVSSHAKDHLDSGGAKRHSQLKWERREGVTMKGFAGTHTLWSLNE